MTESNSNDDQIELDAVEDDVHLLPLPEGGEQTLPEPQEEHRAYFIAAVKVLFLRDAKAKERTVNVLLDLVVPYITQTTLNDINRAAVGRVMKENHVDGEEIKEAIILNISPLGVMPSSTFREEVLPSATTDVAPHSQPIQ